jgi:hypothetical protein
MRIPQIIYNQPDQLAVLFRKADRSCIRAVIQSPGCILYFLPRFRRNPVWFVGKRH